MPRTRSIPEDLALERSLHVFWERGFDRASIADLCQATGLGPSSIYNAFGNKLAFFKKALAHYIAKYAVLATEQLDHNVTADRSIRGFLRGVVTLCTTPGTPPGCLIMQGGGAGSAENSEACAVTNEIKSSLCGAICAMLTARQLAGDRLASEPHALSLFVMASMRGISQLACDGYTEEELLRVADHAAQSCIKPDAALSPEADRLP